MPGIPLVSRETPSCSRSTEQMCHEDSRVHISEEEEIAAEESLAAYCKPVELYNILQRRAIRNPLFLQRCLHYKIEAKHNRRIQMTVFLSGAVDAGVQTQKLFPLYILLARLVSPKPVAEYSAVYRFSRACILTGGVGVDGVSQAQANFLLPDMNRLALEAKSGSLAILFISFAGAQNSQFGIDSGKIHSGNIGGHCLWSKIPLQSLYASWQKSPNMDLGQRVDSVSLVEMQPCFIKLKSMSEEKCVSIQVPSNPLTSSSPQQVQVTISAEEVGATEKSAYSSFSYNDISSSSLFRLRTRNVVFNYSYYNNKLHRTEVTEDFSCPFCLVKCASFKGLRYHLPSTHDLFNFEFWLTEEYQAVHVSLKTETMMSEVHEDDVDPKQQTFYFSSKKFRRRRQKIQVRSSRQGPHLGLGCEVLDKTDDAHSVRSEKSRIPPGKHYERIGGAESSQRVPPGTSPADVQSCGDPDSVQAMAGSTMLQFAKTRKLSIERSDLRNRSLLQKRQFFHSHRAQPMALEQVLSDRDSEDEVDDDVADFEDRRMLDDFVDVTKDEKQMMHMWNSFVRKQRVLADGHIPWACEAFSKLHGPIMVRTPSLIWCWRMFMVKLWNHGLLDARTMNNCNTILEQLQTENPRNH
ncbi:Polycomb group protein EMBRYONIC FLOWER 2 [Cardamine amara subsp. amara]|uniref:Polycomb group protein EMBRYONIC FLOWER 2 n=1 Tax=Cardamine amara subsp. amara TaxID=228776 RepID=A0ABD0ZRQ2_CARAN